MNAGPHPDSEQRSARRPPRATHVGSLVRPPQLVDLMKAATAEAEDAANVAMARREHLPEDMRALEDSLIREVVRKQEDIGLDVVTDGEFRRVFFTGGVDLAIKGFQPNTETIDFWGPGGAELTAPARPVAAERLEKIANPLVEEVSFMQQVATRPFKVTMPAASIYQWYGVYTPGITDKAYRDQDEFADHVVAILRQFVDEVIAAGCRHIQFDFPFYPLFVFEHHKKKWQRFDVGSDEAYLARCLRVDRQLIEGLPGNVFTELHLCRGNAGEFWLTRGSLEPVAEQLFQLPYDSFLVEWDDKERDGGYEPLRHVPRGGPIVGLGVVSTKRAEIESEDAVLREMEEAAQHLDYDQLAIAPQCGFGTVAFMQNASEDTQWRKLEVVARVADRIWPR